ncbi:hypothetical protein GCM10022251_36950 [Phytohabitans flavus]|uniref:acylphosphatase n=1 Tax=Phytohabitans flavus TaxID=1076124 RepID=A0A6F8XVW5_9ACTN|nr:hypothetical protein Pflav_044120 [Phytohabitans flavus]
MFLTCHPDTARAAPDSEALGPAGKATQPDGNAGGRRYCDLVIRRRVLVSGDVQGVFFRDTCRRVAGQQGVAGWVRNLPDGRVEAVFEAKRRASSIW